MPRPSSIVQLPPDILARLQACLQDARVSQLETVDVINELLEAEGLEQRITKSAVNRYKLRMDRVGAKIRESREVAQMFVGQHGAEPQGEVGKILNEFIRTIAFNTTLTLSESDDPVPPKMIKDLSIAIERLERAASINVERDKKIREQAKQEAADKVEKIAKKGGLTKQTADAIRAEILGIPSG